MASRWLVGIACALGVVAAFAIGISVGRHTPQTEATMRASSADHPSGTDRTRVIEREQATAIAQLSWIKTESDLDAYLGKLEAQAQQRGEVTADEVMPGEQVIQAMSPIIGAAEAMRKNGDFHHRMARLSARLRGEQRNSKN